MYSYEAIKEKMNECGLENHQQAMPLMLLATAKKAQKLEAAGLVVSEHFYDEALRMIGECLLFSSLPQLPLKK